MSVSPQSVDYVGGALALIVPGYVVLRFPRAQMTIPLGTFLFWAITVALGSLLAAMDPSRDAGMLDSLWLLIGWIPGLVYASLLYAVRRCFLRFSSGPAASHDAEWHGDGPTQH